MDPTIEILQDTIHDSNPAGIMRAMLKMRNMGKAAFHLADLEVARRTWELASLALIGEPRLARAAMDERERFHYWIVELKNGIQARKEPGVMLLDKGDFPPIPIMERAILALEFAQIGSIH